MSREVNSSALGLINRALGIAGAGSPKTELIDRDINQILDVGRFVRRSTIEWDRGYAVLRIEHEAASLELGITADPYSTQHAVAGDFSNPPYPHPVPTGSDFWLFGASVRLDTMNVLTNAALSLVVPSPTNPQVFWGLENEDATEIVNLAGSTLVLANWTADVDVAGIFNAQEALGGRCYIPINRRIRRGVTISYRSEVTAACITTCVMDVGLFPVGLGQDAAF